MFNRILSRVTLCAALAVAAVAAQAADWPHWRGPQGNDSSTETGLLKEWPSAGPKQVWEAPLGPGYSSFAVVDGKVYTQYQDDKSQYLAAFDEKTGKPLWKAATGGVFTCVTKHNGPRATPTVEGEFVYALDGSGNLACVKAADGAVVWNKNILALAGAKNLTWGMAGSPFIVGDMILVNPGVDPAAPKGASMMAINKKSGEVIWKTGNDLAGYSTPIEYKGEILFFTEAGVQAVTKDGKPTWSFPWKTKYGVNAANLVPNGDTLALCSGYEHGAAVIQPEGDKAKAIWEKKHFKTNYGMTPLLVDGYLYGTNDPKKLQCVDYKTGEEKWSMPVSATGQLFQADGLFYLFSEDGTLSLLKLTPEKGEVISSVKILPGQQRWAHPVIANGKLYLRDDKKMVCLDVKGQ